MIGRRAMVAGSVLALAGSGPRPRAARAAEQLFLPQGLPGRRLRNRHASGLAGQEAADQVVLPSAKLRNAARAFHLGIHAERVLLRSLPPGPNPG
jgi:hypothetical protein